MKLTRVPDADEATPAEAAPAPARTLATPFGVDETSELLLDLLEATTLIDVGAMPEVRARTGPPSAATV